MYMVWFLVCVVHYVLRIFLTFFTPFSFLSLFGFCPTSIKRKLSNIPRFIFQLIYPEFRGFMLIFMKTVQSQTKHMESNNCY